MNSHTNKLLGVNKQYSRTPCFKFDLGRAYIPQLLLMRIERTTSFLVLHFIIYIILAR